MRNAVRQLEQVRQLGRWLLSLRTLCQWTAAMIPMGVILGIADFGLRLPPGLRGLITVIMLGVAGAWLWRHLRLAWRFAPDLAELALRAERLYPKLAGRLASAVEFALHGSSYASPSTTATLASSTMDATRRDLEDASLLKLVNFKPTGQWALVALMSLLMMLGVTVAWPNSTKTALERWLTPWTGKQWPRRVSLQSQMARQGVWPSDTPLRFAARVERGYQPRLRTWVKYRLIDSSGQLTGDWQTALMNEQARAGDEAPSGRNFERVVEITELLRDRTGRSRSEATSAQIEFYFTAGDDQTAPQTIRLVTRPSVEALRARIDPPEYAQGLVASQDVPVEVTGSQLASLSALQGSRLTLRMELSKPVPFAGVPGPLAGQSVEQRGWASVLPGLAELPEAQWRSGGVNSDAPRPWLEVSFVLMQSMQSPIRLTDEHGLSSTSDRLYRFEATEDRQPVVSVVDPPADDAALPTATIAVEGLGRDDVGISWVELQSVVRRAPEQGSNPAAADTQAVSPTTLNRAGDIRQPQGRVQATLDLNPLKLRRGDEVDLHAVAKDVYALNSMEHEPVRSAPRRLRIVDAATLLQQMQSELANVRQQATRMIGRQQELQSTEPSSAQPRQRDLSQQAAAQSSVVQALQDRQARNRLDDPRLTQTLQQARALLDQAQGSSRRAEQGLEQAASKPQQKDNPELQAARRQQEDVNKSLTDLVNLLDPGRDAVALQLRQLEAIQNNLLNEMRQMLPQTLGKTAEQLTEQEKQKLEEMASRQSTLSEQARGVAQQMLNSAESLRRQSDSPQDQAAAQAMQQAASIAQRQGLSQTMQQAAQSAKQNQLSQAGKQGQQSLDTLRQMLEQLDQQQERERAILQRKLAQLAEVVQQLIRQQQAQLKQLADAQVLPPLEQPLSALRTNTLSAQETAASQQQTAPAGQLLGQAAERQGQGVVALRQSDRAPAQQNQEQSLALLQDALKKLQEEQRKAQAEQNRQQRAELRKAYQELAQKQEALRQQTATTAQGPATRKQRADLMDMGMKQTDLRVEAQALREKVEKTVLFGQLHEQIDQSAAQVSTDLRSGRGDAGVQSEQALIVTTLRAMADALEKPKRNEPFAGDRPEQGGGGGDGGGAPPLVPPLAELRLLRQLQEAVYRTTREVADARAAANDAADDRPVQRLASRQKQLSSMGQKLVEQLKQAGAPGVGGSGPGGAPDQPQEKR